MREILFRGKRTDNGEWWYGLPLRTINKDGEDVLNIQCWERDEEGVIGIYDPVDPETIGQYTGLTDKNGKKIFENDVVKFTDSPFRNSHIGYVFLYQGSFCIKCNKEKIHRIGQIDQWQDMCASGIITYKYEILGNIHENPELLRSDNNAE